MSLTIDNPFRQTDQPSTRLRAHSLSPDPGRDAAPVAPDAPAGPTATDSASLWADEESWDHEDLYAPPPLPTPLQVPTPQLTQPTQSAPLPTPHPDPVPTPRPDPLQAPLPDALPDALPAFCAPPTGAPRLSVPPRRTVAPFPTIRAGGGRHRLPTAVRRRPGPIAAGLMVAATTLAAGSLRLSSLPATHAVTRTAHQCAPVRPGEICG